MGVEREHVASKTGVESDAVEMLGSLDVCVLVHDAETKSILWANRAACQMLEFSLEELRPLKAPDMSSPATQYSRTVGRAWLHDAVLNGESRIEWRYRARSGREIPTDALARRITFRGRSAVMVQFRDIEREQRLERAALQTTQFLKLLAGRSNAGAMVLSSDGVVEFATDTAIELFGADRDQIIDQPLGQVADLNHPDNVSWVDVLDSRVELLQVRMRSRMSDTDQDVRWIGGTLERLDVPEVVVFLLTVHNITAHVDAEEKTAREIDHANYLIRHTAMGDMAMAIAHEIGQPLAAASNFLAGALSRLAPVVTPEDLYGVASAQRQVARAGEIVSALREFVGRLEHLEEDVDLSLLVQECLYFVRIQAAEHDVTVATEFPEQSVFVRCERVLTGQVILNLCLNAIEELGSAPPESLRRLTLKVISSGRNGIFIAEDNGRGLQVDPEMLFMQGITSKARGSGIGLALSQRIISRQRGRMFAANLKASEDSQAEHGGASVGFALPLALMGDGASGSR